MALIALDARKFVEEKFSIDEKDFAENVPHGHHILEIAANKCPGCIFADVTSFDHDAVATFWSKHNHVLVISWRWDNDLAESPLLFTGLFIMWILG
jgi:hypothetical protein